MDIQTIKTLLKARGWTQSELARQVGVTRQAVSLWFQKQGRGELRSTHFLRMGEALGVPVEELARPLPGFGEDHDRIRATLLWDGLFPDLDDLAIAADRRDPRAIGRLVEVYGLYATAKMVGDWVWDGYPTYRRHLHPARRGPLEALIAWRRNRMRN